MQRIFFHEYGGNTYPRGTGDYWRKHKASHSVRVALGRLVMRRFHTAVITVVRDRTCDLEMDSTVVSSPRI